MLFSALPVCPPFLISATLAPLPEQADVLHLEARFVPEAFDESLFQQLAVPAPATLRQALRKRRAEYLASRYTVQQALTTLGIPGFLLTNNAERAPLWPAGIHGSLSHSRNRVCALLTRRADLLPGIDCEQMMTEQQAQEMAEMIISPAEARLLAQQAQPFHQLLTAVFSAKESLYKAVWPQLRQFMEFKDAQVVAITAGGEQMSLRLTRHWSAEFFQGRTFTARLAWQPGEVMSTVIGLRSDRPD